MGERITKVERFIRWCENHKWISILVIIGIIIISLGNFTDALEKICDLFKSNPALISISSTNAPSETAVTWQPPELPPGCSNVTVFFGTLKLEEPRWRAESPHDESYTNDYSTNFFTEKIAPNLTSKDFVTDEWHTNVDAISYLTKDMPSSYVTNEEQMPDYSPRHRHVAMMQQDLRIYGGEGSIESPIWPFVTSNRLFVDVEIPFINERRRILMDTNGDSELSKIPRLWDINYDSNKFEVVNEDTNPVLQVIYKSPSEIHVNGIYVLDKFSIYEAFDTSPFLAKFAPFVAVQGFIGDNKVTNVMTIEDFEKTFPNLKPDTNIFSVSVNAMYRIKWKNQKAIFKYPSALHFHELAN